MWRAIEDEDLRSAISSKEEETFRNRLTAEGQGDPFVAIFGQVTRNFRDAIRSGGNELDPDPANLPDGAIFHAVVIIRQRLCGRFNVGEQTETRRDEYKAASDYLKALAAGDIRPEAPGNETATTQPLPAPAVNASPRRDGWRDQDGI
jgi:hypothetical protein